MKIVSFICLLLGFLLLFRRIRWLKVMSELLRKTQAGIEDAARQRSLANRQMLLQVQREHSAWYKLEQELNYTGLRIRFPFLTIELWVVGNVIAGAGILLCLLVAFKKPLYAMAGTLLLFLAEYLLFRFLKNRTMKRVNDSLIKFLDFLGSYSITAGEITGIFEQISKYMEEPLKTVLMECYYEAQTTGDLNLALLSMAEKVEHPKLKELVRNLEISIRYCADFTALVNGSRKNMREYLRSVEERKGMLREGVLNMLLLFGMSLFVLVTVDRLIAASVWRVVFWTLPGRIALAVLTLIFLLFLNKINGIHK